VLFITHRPACLRAAHRVIRLEAGRIVRNAVLTPPLRVVEASD
jgi:ABC-type transport system involved in cytochrome bd biosynthesis fused ATPase/permease subunit